MFFKPIGITDEGNIITQPLYVSNNNLPPNIHKMSRKIDENLMIDSDQFQYFYNFVNIEEDKEISIASNAELIVDSNLHSFVELGTIAISSSDNDQNWLIRGWLPCDGRELSKESYPELYKVINKLYNTDYFFDSKFRLPDLRGKSPLMYDSSGIVFDNKPGINSDIGQKTFIMNEQQMPIHNHQYKEILLRWIYNPDMFPEYYENDPNYTLLISFRSDWPYVCEENAGNSFPINILPCYIVFQFWIKAVNF